MKKSMIPGDFSENWLHFFAVNAMMMKNAGVRQFGAGNMVW